MGFHTTKNQAILLQQIKHFNNL